MERAAGWLVNSLDEDGCWRRYPTPFAQPGEKAYETHVAWGLFEAARIRPDAGYDAAARRNIDWALTKQAANGWFADCCLDEPLTPLTHTIGYVLRGVLEAHRYCDDPHYLQRGRLTADALLDCQQADGCLPGRLDSNWKGTVDWVCLTGCVQIAWCWLYLYELTGERKYYEAASKANQYVGRTQQLDGEDGIRGGIKGSFPVDGAYGDYQMLNWAAKFFIDSLEYQSKLEGKKPFED